MIKLLKRSLNRCEKVRSFGGLNTSLEQLGNDGSVVKQHAKTTGHDIHLIVPAVWKFFKEF